MTRYKAHKMHVPHRTLRLHGAGVFIARACLAAHAARQGPPTSTLIPQGRDSHGRVPERTRPVQPFLSKGSYCAWQQRGCSRVCYTWTMQHATTCTSNINKQQLYIHAHIIRNMSKSSRMECAKRAAPFPETRYDPWKPMASLDGVAPPQIRMALPEDQNPLPEAASNFAVGVKWHSAASVSDGMVGTFTSGQ